MQAYACTTPMCMRVTVWTSFFGRRSSRRERSLSGANDMGEARSCQPTSYSHGGTSGTRSLPKAWLKLEGTVFS
eukprot:scaffold1493_cov66-Phaeocystis_antarctica.AAC.5